MADKRLFFQSLSEAYTITKQLSIIFNVPFHLPIKYRLFVQNSNCIISRCQLPGMNRDRKFVIYNKKPLFKSGPVNCLASPQLCIET